MSESARDVSTQTDLKQLKREADGSFNRPPSTFRDIVQEGSKYEPEKGICQHHANLPATHGPLTARLGRYHLYVSYGCPWASRTLIVRKLKGLEDIITVSIVSPRMDSNGWPFARVDPFPGAEDDPIYNARYLKDVYLSVEPHYQGRWVDHFPTTVCSVALFSSLGLRCRYSSIRRLRPLSITSHLISSASSIAPSTLCSLRNKRDWISTLRRYKVKSTR